MESVRYSEVKYLAEVLIVNRCRNSKASLCDPGACAPTHRNPLGEAVLTFSLGLREPSFFKHHLGTPRFFQRSFGPFSFLCTRPDLTHPGQLVLCDGTTNATLSGTAPSTVCLSPHLISPILQMEELRHKEVSNLPISHR